MWIKITPHYAKLGDKLLFKNVFPKSGPKYRRQVVNPLITGDHINNTLYSKYFVLRYSIEGVSTLSNASKTLKAINL